MDNFTHLKPDELAAKLAQTTRERDYFVNQAEVYNEYVNALQAEIDRRALDGYFDAHPDLPRIEAGSKIQVTPEMVFHYGGGQQSIGKTIAVRWVGFTTDGAISVDLGTKERPAFAEVIRARLAYLASTANAPSGEQEAQ